MPAPTARLMDNRAGVRPAPVQFTPTIAVDYCFPGFATVTLESGASVAMADLQIGARVLVAPDTFSEVAHQAITTHMID